MRGRRSGFREPAGPPVRRRRGADFVSPQQRSRVLVVYPYLFHYRFGVFRALEQRSDLDVTFVSDVAGRQGIAATPPGLLKKHYRVRTIVLSRFTWQVGLLLCVAVRRYDVAVFHGDMWSLSTWAAAAIARIRRRRVLFWTIGWHRPDPYLLRRVRVLFYKLAHELLIYGNVGRSIGVAMGYPPARMHVIYNSHASSQQVALGPDGEGVTLPRDAVWTVGAVIRLTAVKRLDLLLEAAADLSDRGVPIRVILAGEGPERERLEQLGRRRGVDVIFTGAIYSSPDLASFYEAVDVTVVPAAAGLTVIQSLSHGVPVVTDDDDYGQMPEAEAVVDGATGARYARGDVSQLALKIAQVIERAREDPAGTAARAREEVEARWTPEAQSAKIHSRIRAHVLPVTGRDRDS
jgi:glycosyltransferase involved in cell wall biosynthesis